MSVKTNLTDFISRWTSSGAAERANYQLFLCELCDIIGVPRPEPAKADSSENAYVFEHPVLFDDGFGHTTTKFIDLYRREVFILEAKQGSDKEAREDETGLKLQRKSRKGTAIRGTQGWDDAMLAARGQAELYAKALPASEGWPPFLVVVDVGHSIELFADFTRSGKTYVAFPDALTHRIQLKNLAEEAIRERLRLVWTDPLELDPSRKSAKVTREVAARLAELAKSLERSGHKPEKAASFLMRCLFTMFAEDVGLLPKASFTKLLEDRRGKLSTFPDMLASLWETMDKGGFSPILDMRLLRFNGQLFANSEALPITEAQLELLIEAAKADWSAVEPAIFGTLLERALDPIERHKLGAHYTPRAYVERLVLPTIIEPLREEWEASKAAAVTLAKSRKMEDARKEVQSFLTKLCSVTVLDPACGSGNFLYVTLEHLKRLEGEVRDVLRGLGRSQEVFEGVGFTIDPHQLLGIELNPRAAAIAELVLWIGYLQWHFRTFGARMPAEPIIKAFHNIECRDAVLKYETKEHVIDENGQPVTRWDGRTTKKHPVTGEEVPDETARTPVFRYINPRVAEWPKADFVVGNPPFIGGWKMRSALGDGYVETLWQTYPHIPQKADFVIYWWDKAAEMTRANRVRQFGFITTNSVTQIFQRRVLQSHLDQGLSLRFAIPDHPWVDSENGASVRVAMTVAKSGEDEGKLLTVTSELFADDDDAATITFKSQAGLIQADLSIGAAVSKAVPLRANDNVISPGVQLYGDGFIVSAERAASWGQAAELARRASVLRRYINGRDLMQTSRNVEVVDFFGFDEDTARREHPVLYQHLLDYVKPERELNARESIKRTWWRFGWERPVLRKQIQGLRRFIVTTETAKHRVFVFLDASVLPDNMLTTIALDDAFSLGILSSRIHVRWSLSAGGRLGVGNDPRYTKARCFDPFPFPSCEDSQKARIRELAEQLDVHRKRQQTQYPTLTLTGIYNILEKLRSGEPLLPKEKAVHEQGLVSVLKQLHNDLDDAVFDAYGWPAELSDDEILARLVALNAERAAEESQGTIRWLRPEFQNPTGHIAATQGTLIEDAAEPVETTSKKSKTPWPKTLAEQAQAVRSALGAHRTPVTPEQLAKTFLRARVDRVEELLDTLASLGQARELDDGRFAAPSLNR